MKLLRRDWEIATGTCSGWVQKACGNCAEWSRWYKGPAANLPGFRLNLGDFKLWRHLTQKPIHVTLESDPLTVSHLWFSSWVTSSSEWIQLVRPIPGLPKLQTRLLQSKPEKYVPMFKKDPEAFILEAGDAREASNKCQTLATTKGEQRAQLLQSRYGIGAMPMLSLACDEAFVVVASSSK